MTLGEQIGFLEKLNREYINLAEAEVKGSDGRKKHADYAMTLIEVARSLHKLQEIKGIANEVG